MRPACHIVLEDAVQPLTLDDCNGTKFDGFLADTSIMTCVNNVCHILVRFGSLRQDRNILSLQHPAGFETPDRVKYLNSSWKFLEAIMQMYAQRSCSGNNVSRNIPGVLHWTICPCAHRITWSIHAHYINSALTLISSIISHQISSLYTVIYY